MLQAALGRFVRERRIRAGLKSQVALSERIKKVTGATVHANYLSRLEGGKVGIPGRDKRDAIGAVLKISEPDWLRAIGEFGLGPADGCEGRGGVADEIAAGILRERPDVAAKFRELDEKYADRPHVAEQMKGHILRQLASTVSNSLDIALADT